MNISQPISSAIDNVEFSFRGPDEIKRMSVKRIESAITFDNFLNPIHGGLYDPALGPFGEFPCATCNLTQASCPGHVGHIELPVPVYHPVFMDQIMAFMRAQCVYCHRFRLRRADVELYKCKLRLLQYGLVDEAIYLDTITVATTTIPGVDAAEFPDEAEDEAEGDTVSMEKVIRLRQAYTDQALKKTKLSTAEIRTGKHEGAAGPRAALVKEFRKEMLKPVKCNNCSGISPKYRKDGFVKIFEKALTGKAAAQMAQRSLKRENALAVKQKAKSRDSTKKGKKEKEKELDRDEGVADVDSASSEGEVDQDEDEDDESEGDGEELDENGDVRMGDSALKAPKTKEKKAAAPQRYVSSMEVLALLELLFEKETEMMRLLRDSKPSTRGEKPPTPASFFLQVVMVPPNKFRPEARRPDGVEEAQQNSLYKMILGASSRVAQVYRDIYNAKKEGADVPVRQRDASELHLASVELQNAVNSLVDKDRNPVRGAAAKRNEDGIKQKLEKKEGLFRKNMMGKRVNYAARSVISPDPNIETSEIGVPPVFAKKLTYPEPVTSHNFREMQQAVINGPDKWPGANAIENENGQIINLTKKSADARVALANQLLAPTNHNQSGIKGKKVHRHLGNGDVVLMNRQPTLHKPSIMGHRVRVLPGEKTIRMHYANCNTYNADFDGDEMNMHFPQNEVARAEAMQLADTDHQYLSGTAGKPLRGLIQDHISVSVALCSKDAFFDKGAYQQLVYNALRPEHGHITSERLELVPPAVLKPVRRWTGKQVVTTILKNIKPLGFGDLWLTGKTQIPAERWAENSEEGRVLFQDGEFIHGILDKSQLGPSSGGFIHSIHEVWAPVSASRLLSCMGRLLTKYLNMRAFTCGMDDLRLTPEGEKARLEQLQAASTVGFKVAKKYVSLDHIDDIDENNPTLLERLEDVMRDDSKQEGLDLLMNQACSGEISGKVTAACLPTGLAKQFPWNQMQAMTISGAKGTRVNANLISCNLGQQVLEGRRVPVMVSGKTLPSFRPFETHVRAGGYIVNRFLTGIRPQEYYFHHMAGREGLIDTAVKTSRSGYLQRCLIKGMEGLKVAYDTTVREADGTIVQFLYGEDGLDITKQQYLNDFGFVLRNRVSEVAQLGIDERGWDQDIFSSKDYAQKYMKKAVKEARMNGVKARDPISAELNPNRHAFATSEKFYEKVTQYIKENKDGLLKEKGDKSKSMDLISRKYAEILLHTKYLNSLVEPGEAIGVVAGQSVGEPSTQMTLNTFHLAGHSAKNVTLGIPRLREILMTASDHISTPSMTLILNEELPEETAEKFAKSISVLPLSHVTNKVTVKERIGRGVGHKLAKVFDIRLEFFKSGDYSETYAVGISDVLDVVESKFLSKLEKMISKEVKQRAEREDAARPEIGVKAGNVEMAPPDAERVRDEDDDDDDDGEEDATNAKQQANRAQAVSYGANDDDDDEIQKRAGREASPVDDEDAAEDEGFGGSPPPESDEDEGERRKGSTALNRSREERVKEKSGAVSRFECDETKGEWCDFSLEYDASTPKLLMLNLVEEAVRKTLVQQIEGVGTCTYVASEEVTDIDTGAAVKRAVIHTEGVNLVAMQKYGEFINPNQIQTNDIASVLRVYGVEAARKSITLELSSVFVGHSISVDDRHLNLIGDYMTRNGGFTPFNRNGLKGNVSPFTKMSFETTLAFLKDAILDGDWDDLTTPSSRIVMGKLSKVGTGAFDVLTRVRPRNGNGQI